MKTSTPQGSALRQYMLILRRGTPIVALTTVVLIGLAILQSNRQQALYQATTQVIVNPNNIDPSIADAQPNIDPERVLETQASEARVPSVIRQALARFPTRQDRRLFLLRSSVTADPKSNVLTFTVTDPDRLVA